jgi:hypothetical protein
MKPLGLYPSLWSNHGDRAALDDDYAWHVRQVASQRAVAASAGRPRFVNVTEKLGGLARLVRTRTGAATARRI